jgi:pantothenate kinase-related protein Tda10
MTPEGMMVKEPLPGSVALLEKVQARLGPNRLPLLIAIDGPDGVGKSSLASWLAWQVSAPAVHLDLYLNRDSKPLSWRTEELRRIVGTRLGRGQPVVVEGIMVLDVLTAISHKADFLVYLDGEGGYTLSERLAAYRARHQPEQRADVRMQGFAE